MQKIQINVDRHGKVMYGINVNQGNPISPMSFSVHIDEPRDIWVRLMKTLRVCLILWLPFKCDDQFEIKKRNQQLRNYILQIHQSLNSSTCFQTKDSKVQHLFWYQDLEHLIWASLNYSTNGISTYSMIPRWILMWLPPIACIIWHIGPTKWCITNIVVVTIGGKSTLR